VSGRLLSDGRLGGIVCGQRDSELAAPSGPFTSKTTFAATSCSREQAENAGQLVGRDALSAVAHAEHDMAGANICAHTNVTLGRCI